MLLFNVRVNVEQSVEAAWNDWHFTHMPHLASTPGYVSARRYLAALPGVPRYAALYEIREELLQELLGEDLGRRHPLTLIDGPAFESQIYAGVDHFAYSVFVPAEPTAGGLLDGDLPYVEARFDVDPTGKDDALKALTESVAPALRADPRVASARAYGALEDDTIPWLGNVPTPPVMLLVQLREASDLEAVAALLARDEVLNGGALGTMSCAAYRQVARFWPMPSDLYSSHLAAQVPDGS